MLSLNDKYNSVKKYNNKTEILKVYNEQHNSYPKFERKIKDLLEYILKEIPIQQIVGRIKEEKSLAKKIDNKNKYKNIEDITDIIGLRIITYLPNNVDKIYEILKKEFKVDEKNSIDKRVDDKEADQFGYMSLHLVCELDEERVKLPEYKDLKNIKFEIQVRSILQHAWAEIEHDIGYKGKNELPKKIKRRFFRLASLLELADEEFQNIVDILDADGKNKETVGISEYIVNVNEDIKYRTKDLQSKHQINRLSLQEYIDQSSNLMDIKSIVMEKLECDCHSGMFAYGDLIKMLYFTNCSTIECLDNHIKENKELIIKMIINHSKILKEIRDVSLIFGKISGILYAIYINVFESNSNTQKIFMEKFCRFKEDFIYLKNAYDDARSSC